MSQQVTFRFPDGTRVRTATQRAFVLISKWTDPDNGKVHTRIEKRSDQRAVLQAERRRRVAAGSAALWFLGITATRELEVMNWTQQ